MQSPKELMRGSVKHRILFKGAQSEFLQADLLFFRIQLFIGLKRCIRALGRIEEVARHLNYCNAHQYRLPTEDLTGIEYLLILVNHLTLGLLALTEVYVINMHNLTCYYAYCIIMTLLFIRVQHAISALKKITKVLLFSKQKHLLT